MNSLSHVPALHLNAKAAIFDMDGTMFDTEALYARGMARAGAEFGYDIHHGIYLGTIGLPEIGWKTHLRNTFGPDFPLDVIASRTLDNVHAELELSGLPIKPGLIELLDQLDDWGVPYAIASSSKRKIIQRNLGLANMAARFLIVVGGEEVQHGKPAPDIFLEAAHRLNAAPADCVVLEDSEAGIRGAHAAGMIPIMIPDLKPPSDEMRQLARAVLPSLHAVREWMKVTNGE
jgi:HAD superfamily hydrolase (TIGR01509 family)